MPNTRPRLTTAALVNALTTLGNPILDGEIPRIHFAYGANTALEHAAYAALLEHAAAHEVHELIADYPDQLGALRDATSIVSRVLDVAHIEPIEQLRRLIVSASRVSRECDSHGTRADLTAAGGDTLIDTASMLASALVAVLEIAHRDRVNADTPTAEDDDTGGRLAGIAGTIGAAERSLLSYAYPRGYVHLHDPNCDGSCASEQ